MDRLSIRINAVNLTDQLETYEQGDLFAPQQPAQDARRERLEQAMDAIRGKYGKGAIAYGSALGPRDAGDGAEE